MEFLFGLFIGLIVTCIALLIQGHTDYKSEIKTIEDWSNICRENIDKCHELNQKTINSLSKFHSESFERLNNGWADFCRKSTDDMITRIENSYLSIPLSDETTLGYVIKTVLPDVKWYLNEDGEVFTDHKTHNSDKIRIDFTLWNTPYKEVKSKSKLFESCK